VEIYPDPFFAAESLLFFDVHVPELNDSISL